MGDWHRDCRELTSGQAYAGQKEEGCTLATLNGQYLFNGSGTLFPPAFGVTSASTGTSAGFHIFNGDGTGTDFVTFSVNGTVVGQFIVRPDNVYAQP